MGIESKFEKNKNYIEKNIEAVRIINNEILDIINGQGCLIKPETTILFGPDDKGNQVKIKDFKKPYKVTSHGYMNCAEVIGALSNEQKFYIHAMEPIVLEKILLSILEEAQKESADKKITISKIKVKFDKYTDTEDVVENKKQDYIKCTQNFCIGAENVELKIESFIGYTPEKVVGYNTEEEKMDFNYPKREEF